MGLAEKVTKWRYAYHLNVIEMNNVLNQLGLRKDEIAEEIAAKHVMTIFNDILPRLYGKEAVDRLLKRES